MTILQSLLSIPNPLRPRPFSFSISLTPNQFPFPSIPISTKKYSIIRMGGGPRTFPGGVSKWQWKRMQAKKSKQLLKARLSRERQIYEMRKRAELKAAVSELERLWEVVEKTPNLFSVSADEQVKVLADRFQRPGGFDLWTDKDGPQLFQTFDELPSARFFPKGVIHSVRPYKSIAGSEGFDSDSDVALEDENGNGTRGGFSGWKLSEGEDNSGSDDSYSKRSLALGRNGKVYDGKLISRRNRRRVESNKMAGSMEFDSGLVGLDSRQRDSIPRTHSRPVGSMELDRRKRGPSSHTHSKPVGSMELDRRHRDPGPRTRSKPVGSTELDRRQRVTSTRTNTGTRQQYGGGKNPSRVFRGSNSETYDMSLEQDGSYRFQPMKRR